MRTRIKSEQPLPSGLIVDVQPWTTGDMMRMDGASEGKLGLMIDELLGSCTVIDDPRQVYGWAPGTKINGRKMLVGDRIVLTIYQRMLTLPDGHLLIFEFPCLASVECHKRQRRSGWRIDLRRLLLPWVPDPLNPDQEMLERHGMTMTEVKKMDDKGNDTYHPAVIVERFGLEPIVLGDDLLYMRELSEAARAAFTDGNRMLFTDFEENKVWWKQFLGEDVASMPTIDPSGKHGPKDKAELGMEALRRRIVEVETIERKNLLHWIDGWNWGSADELHEIISETECGLETELDVRCVHCKQWQVTEAPLMTPLFFSRATQQKRRSGARSSRS